MLRERLCFILIVALFLLVSYSRSIELGLFDLGFGGGIGYYYFDEKLHNDNSLYLNAMLALKTKKGNGILPDSIRNRLGLEGRIGLIFYKPGDDGHSYGLSLNPYINVNLFLHTTSRNYPYIGVGTGLVYERFDYNISRVNTVMKEEENLDFEFHFLVGTETRVSERVYLDINFGLWYLFSDLPSINYRIFEDISENKEGYAYKIYTGIIFF